MNNNLTDILIIFGAKYLIFIVLIFAFIYFLTLPRNKQKEIVTFGIITLLLTYIVALIAGHCYYNPRPFVLGHSTPLVAHSPDNGFPSDHMLLASAVAMIIFFFNKKVGTGLGLLAILIGTARVLAGVHHYIDIVGSVIISLVIACLSYYFIFPRLRKMLQF